MSSKSQNIKASDVSGWFIPITNNVHPYSHTQAVTLDDMIEILTTIVTP